MNESVLDKPGCSLNSDPNDIYMHIILLTAYVRLLSSVFYLNNNGFGITAIFVCITVLKVYERN